MEKPAWAKGIMRRMRPFFENKHWVFEEKFVLAEFLDANCANFRELTTPTPLNCRLLMRNNRSKWRKGRYAIRFKWKTVDRQNNALLEFEHFTFTAIKLTEVVHFAQA